MTESQVLVKADQFAEKAHSNQKRKWQDTPYIVHPRRVADRVMKHPQVTSAMIAAAYLHDVIEDCAITPETLLQEFGPEITQLVIELTNSKEGKEGKTREERKALDRARLKLISTQAKIIKLIDRIDNLQDLSSSGPDKKFKEKYALESKLLAEVIGDADLQLKQELLIQIQKIYDSI